jgi:hypothetical protein
VLLKRLVAGRKLPAQALRLIRSAHHRADQLRDLLRARGDKHCFDGFLPRQYQ